MLRNELCQDAENKCKLNANEKSGVDLLCNTKKHLTPIVVQERKRNQEEKRDARIVNRLRLSEWMQ